MKKVLLLVNVLACYFRVKAQSPIGKVSSLDAANVSLKGRNAITIVINHTSDTVKLTGNIYYYLPVAEQSVKISLPPGKSDTLRTLFFIRISWSLVPFHWQSIIPRGKLSGAPSKA